MGVVDSTVDAFKSAVKSGAETASRLAHEAYELPKTVVGGLESAAVTAFSGMKSTLSAVGFGGASPVATGSHSEVDGQARSANASVAKINETLASFGNPSNFVQQDGNTLVSKDGRLTIHRAADVNSGGCDTNKVWNLLDGQAAACRAPGRTEPQSLEMNTRGLFAGLQGAETRPEARVRTTDGNGNDTQITQTPERATITQGNHVVSLDRLAQELRISTSDMQLIQNRDGARVQLNDGTLLERRNGKVYLLRADGRPIAEVQQDRTILGNTTFARRPEDLDRIIQDVLGSDRLQMVVGGDRARLIATDGSFIEQRPDGSALLSDRDGTKFVIDRQGRVFVVDGDNLVPFDQWRGRPGVTRDQNGNIQAPGVRIDTHSGEAEVDGGRYNYREGRFSYTDPEGRPVQLRRQRRPDGTFGFEFESPDLKATPVTTGNGVRLELPSGRSLIATPGEAPAVETPGVRIDTNGIDLDTNGGRIHIAPNNDVKMSGGIQLSGDGSIQFSDGFISAGGAVSYSNGRGIAGLGEAGCAGVPHAEACRLAASAESVSMQAHNSAQAIVAKAMSGAVTYADISRLNQDLADVSGLLGQLIAIGGGPQIAELQVALGDLDRALEVAVPRARVA